MQYNPPQYYRPYDDAEDEAAGRARSNSSTTDFSQSSETSTTSSQSSGMDTGDTIDPRYELIRAAGPEMAGEDRQLNFEEGLNYAKYPFQPPPPFPDKQSVSLLQKNPNTKNVATLFSINSQNRDFQSYPYASYFTLQLPRIFKNVNAVNIIQISFPTISGVIPDNTSAINLDLEKEIIQTVFNLRKNPNTINYCDPPVPTQSEIDTIIDKIVDGTLDPTYLLPKDYNLCNSIATANCSTGVASCLDSMFIYENGRTNPAKTNELLQLVYSIEPGRYTSDSIVDALNSSFNSTFYFENITFADYKEAILANKGAIEGFPFPNQYFYNNLTGKYTDLGSEDIALARRNLSKFYFPNIDTIFSTPPTNQEIFVSYYYPVLKEVCINPNLRFLLNYKGYTIPKVYADVVTGFFGLNYQLYVDMCKNNVEFLTLARRYYTQEYYNVNQYSWYFNQVKNRIGVTFNTLNRSIRFTISSNYINFQNQALSSYGKTLDDYKDAKDALSNVNTGLPVLEPMALKFATDMGSLGVEVQNYTFEDISDEKTLYNTENTTALQPGFNILQEKAGYTNSDTTTNKNYGQWPELKNLDKNYDFFQDLSGFLGIDTNYPYSVDAQQFIPIQFATTSTRAFGIDFSDNVFITNGLYTDIFVNVSKTRYVIIPFRSPNKQNIQISTLSRPYKYRYPAWNLSQGAGASGYSFIPGVGDPSPSPGIQSLFFNNSPFDYFNYYDDEDNPKFNTIPMDSYVNIYNLEFYTTLEKALTDSPFEDSYQTNFLTPFNYFRITPPSPSDFNTYPNPFPSVFWNTPYSDYYGPQTNSLPQVSFRYKATLTIVPFGSDTFSGGLTITIYNDYALFTADLKRGINNSNENYKYIFTVNPGDTSGNIEIPIYSHLLDQEANIIPKYYYVKVSQVSQTQTTQDYQLALWNEYEVIRLYKGFILPDISGSPVTNFNNYTWSQAYSSAKRNGVMSYWYAQGLDSDFNASRIVNDNNPQAYQFNRTIQMKSPYIGHDQNGISTDLTDYRGFYLDSSGYNPDAQYYADPVTGYYFNLLSDYSQNTHTYFYSGSQNSVFNPQFKLYTFTSIPSTFFREFKFTHWWDTHYIGPQTSNYVLTGGIIDTPDLSCVNLTSIQNYNRNSVSPSTGLYGYSYYDWSLEFPDISNQFTTLFDYNYTFPNTPPSPPQYSNTRNVCGFTFTLPDGIYKLKQFTFKSAWFGPESEDPNNQITKLYIYNAGTINQKNALTLYGGDTIVKTGTYNPSTTIFTKDLTNINNAIINCTAAELPPGATQYVLTLNKPFEGQNFIITNVDVPFYISALFTNPLAITDTGLLKYFIYRNGRWNFYLSTISSGLPMISSLDYNIAPVAILNRKQGIQGRVSYGPNGNAPNPAADKTYGTYYTFEIDTTYSNPNFNGGSLPSAQYQSNYFSSYVAVAHSLVEDPLSVYAYSLFTPAPIWLLAGSLVPHPDAEEPSGSTSSPVDPWPSTNGDISNPYEGQLNEQSMIIPQINASLPYITGSPLESQIGQSMPITTTGIFIGLCTPIPALSYSTTSPETVFNISYQAFWPVQNIIFERVATTYKPMIELNTIINPDLLDENQNSIIDFSGAFEYPRSQLFYYDNLTDLFADISDSVGGDGYRWGFESRYKEADLSFNGYANNSYIYNLTPGTDDVGYLLLRAYSPTEQFQTIVRFAIRDSGLDAKTRGLYTFGLKTTKMLTDEYTLLQEGETNFTPEYKTSLQNFWNNFIGGFVFGIEKINLIGFNDITGLDTDYFLGKFRSLWSSLQSDIAFINNIDTYTLNKINSFINTRYKTVLPPNLLNYNALNGDTNLPVTFYGDILGIQNSTPFVTPTDCTQEGICQGITSRIQNSFSCFPAGATIPTLEVQVGFPFATVTAVANLEGDVNNVINQNLYLQLNEEYTFNNMSVALEESAPNTAQNIAAPQTLSGVPSSIRTQNSVISTVRNNDFKTKEFRGSSKIVMGKIILNNSTDNVTQTLLQAPAVFNPPLGKLESLTFKVLTKDLFPAYLVFPYVTPELEWNGVVSITEEVTNIPTEETSQIARINVDSAKLPF